MLPFSIFGRTIMHACKLSFLGPRWNWATGLIMHAATQLLEKNAKFWLGVGLTVQEVCVISGQSS